jgi:hypothetical protein
LRHFRIAVSLQLAVMLAAPSVAWSLEQASDGDSTPAEHVRHLRSRKAAKPTLSTEEDKLEAKETAEPASHVAATPKVTADATKPAAPRPKKVAAKPAPTKVAAVKQRSAARPDLGRPSPSAAPAASRGFLEDIFGDN